MFKHISDLSILCAIFFIAAISLLGWGQLIANWISDKSIQKSLCFKIWLGVIAGTFYAEALQLIFPVNWIGTSIFTGLGLVFSIKLKSVNSVWYKVRAFQQQKILLILAIVIIFIWASKSFSTPSHYDFALYYEPTIQWLNKYSISLGLANLHSRFGFNQSLFSLAALFNIYPFWGHGLIGANLFLLLLTGASTVRALAPLKNLGFKLLSIILFVLVDVVYVPVSPSPDATIGALELIIFIIILRIYLKESNLKNDNKMFCIMLILLGTFSVSIKLSSLVFVVACIVIASKDIILSLRKNPLPIIKAIIICIIFFAIHLVRGYLISGYPFYPSTLAGISTLPWALPIETARGEMDWIYSWSRIPGKDPTEVLGNWDWFPLWLNAFPLRGKVMFALSAVLITLNYLISKKKTDNCSERLSITSIYIPLLCAVAFWFITAPDFRFLGIIPDLLCILSIFIFFQNFDECYHWKLIKKYFILVFLFIAIFISVSFFLDIRVLFKFLMYIEIYRLFPNPNYQTVGWEVEEVTWLTWRTVNIALIFLFFISFPRNRMNTVCSNRLRYLGSSLIAFAIVNQSSLVMGFFLNDQLGWRPHSLISFTEFLSESGLITNIPIKGDQCGNTPFPCAPSKNPYIHTLDHSFDLPLVWYRFPNLGVK